MNNDIGNTLLKRCGEPEMPDIIDIGLLPQETSMQCASCAALEEHNANQAREIDELKLEIRGLRERLAGREFD